FCPGRKSGEGGYSEIREKASCSTIILRDFKAGLYIRNRCAVINWAKRSELEALFPWRGSMSPGAIGLVAGLRIVPSDPIEAPAPRATIRRFGQTIVRSLRELTMQP